MTAVDLFFALGWVAFWVGWLVAALYTKRGSIPWSRHVRIRLVLVVLAALVLRTGVFRHQRPHTDPWLVGLGVALFVLGLGLAIWARIHIGRNWGGPMTQKFEPELVTSGPYHFIRHPIYTGILLAGFGTALAVNWLWLVAVVLAGIYFVYCARMEERYLAEQFPDTYETYRHATRMLVPFVF